MQPSTPNGPNIGFVRKEVIDQLPKWSVVDDCIAGEIAIKSKGVQYLPKPDANADPVKNEKQYSNYSKRAVFFPVTGRTLSGLSGQVYSKPVNIEIPSQLELMIENVDGSGTTLEQQSKQVLNSVLARGRAGLLSDFPTVEPGAIVTRADMENGKYRPRVIFYHPRQIVNWREKTFGGETMLSLLVLQEEKIIEDDGFEFKTSPRWRVLQLVDNAVEVSIWRQVTDDTHGTEVEYELDPDGGEPKFLTGANKQPLVKIPFSFVGATNNDSSVDESPLFPLASMNIAHFRNSADHEQSLFLVGQPTPVFTGLSNDWVDDHITGRGISIGSSNAVVLPVGASAMLLQAAANGMPMEGMLHKEDQMKAIGAKLIEPKAVERTATEAEIEETSEASVLSSIAKNVSAAYRDALYHCSLYIGETDIRNISVELNSDFQVMGLSAPERKEVIEAWQGGILTRDEARNVYRRKGIATEPDDEAFEKIEQEQASFAPDESIIDASFAN